MNRIGPLPRRLTATVAPDGTIGVFARSPGPAGLATIRLADGRVDLAIDVAEPENLVSLTVDDPRDPLAQRVLQVLFDGSVLDALADVAAGRRAGSDEGAVVWSLDPGEDDGSGRPWDRKPQASRRGTLGRIGRLALVHGELIRVERSPFATALGLFEAASLAAVLQVDLAPRPTAPELAAAALDHLARTNPSAWAPDLDPTRLDALVRALDRLDRSLEHVVPEAGSQLERARQLLRARQDRQRTDRFGGAAVQDLALESRFDLPPAAAPSAVVGGAPRSSARRVDAPAGPPVEVLVDPSADGLTVTTAAVEAGHVVVTGAGNAVDAWLRVFDHRPTPVLLALAPLQASGVGRWRSRALLPGEAQPDRLRVDLTTRPAEPWRSPPTRWASTAIDLGATAARATRAGDHDAPRRWDRAADAWTAAGQHEQAEHAHRLRSRSVEELRPAHAARRGPDEGPLALDLVD